MTSKGTSCAACYPRSVPPPKKSPLPEGWLPDILAASSAPAPARGPAPPVRAAPPPPPADMALVRRILDARAPDALTELEEGLLEARRGEAALVAWLDRPVEDSDPLDALRGNLSRLTRSLSDLPKGRANASLYNSITSTVKAIEGIMSKRPRELSKDEIEERIAAYRDEAVKKISEYTSDAAKKLEADRAELSTWGRSVLGPVGGAELDRRVGLMLGDADGG